MYFSRSYYYFANFLFFSLATEHISISWEAELILLVGGVLRWEKKVCGAWWLCQRKHRRRWWRRSAGRGEPGRGRAARKEPPETGNTHKEQPAPVLREDPGTRSEVHRESGLEDQTEINLHSAYKNFGCMSSSGLLRPWTRWSSVGHRSDRRGGIRPAASRCRPHRPGQSGRLSRWTPGTPKPAQTPDMAKLTAANELQWLHPSLIHSLWL